MKFVLRIMITTLAVLVACYLLPHSMVSVDSLKTAVIVALVLAFLNAVVKPAMIVLTIPATVFSFGLFLLVINAVIILIADHFVDGFKVHGFWSALIFSIIVSIVSSLLNPKRVEVHHDRWEE